jgi:hypothetical protein
LADCGQEKAPPAAGLESLHLLPGGLAAKASNTNPLGEHLTVEFIKEFSRKVWKDKISFVKLDLENPEKVPVNPGTVRAAAALTPPY